MFCCKKQIQKTIILRGSKQIPQKTTSVSQVKSQIFTRIPIFQGCTEFALPIQIYNTSESQEKGHIFSRTQNFASVLLLSAEQLFFSAEVVFSRPPQIPSQKETTKQLFYRTGPSGCFSLVISLDPVLVIGIKTFFRSSRPEVFLRKGALKICSKFAGNHTST